MEDRPGSSCGRPAGRSDLFEAEERASVTSISTGLPSTDAGSGSMSFGVACPYWISALAGIGVKDTVSVSLCAPGSVTGVSLGERQSFAPLKERTVNRLGRLGRCLFVYPVLDAAAPPRDRRGAAACRWRSIDLCRRAGSGPRRRGPCCCESTRGRGRSLRSERTSHWC